MKIALVSSSDSQGGAAIATYRLANALYKRDKDIRLIVSEADKEDAFLESSIISKKAKIRNLIYNQISRLALQKIIKDTSCPRTLNLLPGNLLDLINSNHYDSVNIHWINNGSLSIKDISKIKSKKILTLHDMWAMCGSEHLVEHPASFYFNNSHDANVHIIDKYLWNRKRRFWSTEMELITPSEWLRSCVLDSKLFSRNPVSVLPNTLDPEIFTTHDQNICKEILGLNKNKKIIGMGFWSGSDALNKGISLLKSIINSNLFNPKDVAFVFFGHKLKANIIYEELKGFELTFLGPIRNEFAMATFYNAIDVTLVPSRVESFSQVSSESQFCGTPVIAFNATGVKETISHQKSGYLATAYDNEDFALGIDWVLKNLSKRTHQKLIRDRALTLWAPDIVVERYMDILKGSNKI
ncbi:glycosyltransferase [Pokkaliibacter sp. CJK22405]|uniref:glycosyltransferase n=1 Tax=Pokkaliibacter sp. CJK22405 TaxID=3384615 RepID=UPI0039847565